MINPSEQSFFASCPKSIEALLQAEIENLGGRDVKQTVAGVHFNGSLSTAYRVCLWSRLANRLLLPLIHHELNSAEDVYSCARSIAWSQLFSEQNTLLVDFLGTSDLIRHTRFGAQRIKDAVVDHFTELGKPRPSVEFTNPDVRINAYLASRTLTISLDLSGDSLHKRGYRQESKDIAAPLKENLAAALLLRAGWNNDHDYQYLLDPMCGSGTLVIEAALMAMDIAPGLLKNRFGFEAFHFHATSLWEDIKTEAVERKNHGLTNNLPKMIGYDQSAKAIGIARNNAVYFGLNEYLEFRQQSLQQLDSIDSAKGLIITNPPYGKRLQDKSELPALFRLFGERLAENHKNSDVAILLEDAELGFHLGYRLSKQYRFYNGAIACRLLTFNINDSQKIKNPGKPKPVKLPDEVQPFINRLLKNKKSLTGWLTQNNIHCYRLYDADIPEFAAAIDIYEDYAHIQEYAAPASVKPTLARKRIDWIVQAVSQVLEIEESKVFLKRRERQRGQDQYQVLDKDTPDIIAREGEARFYINLGAYLDTGLFLDHRPIRQYFYKNSNNKRLLNLFCYTGSVSVQAALAGAKTTNIDLSTNYIDWAKRNFELNRIPLKDHIFYSKDILQWMPEEKSQYDIIFLDPPTFSNSKKMKWTFDLQRDHVDLIDQCMELLAPNGELYFSNNFKKFKLDNNIIDQYLVKDLTQWSIPRDFSRRKIHHCWKITKTT